MTPNNAPYKQEQRSAKSSKRRRYPLWTSCVVIDANDGIKGAPVKLVKMPVDGTYRREKPKYPRGKANVKAEKRATHQRHYYERHRFAARIEKDMDKNCGVEFTGIFCGDVQ